jgi:hypothetical protein
MPRPARPPGGAGAAGGEPKPAAEGGGGEAGAKPAAEGKDPGARDESA